MSELPAGLSVVLVEIAAHASPFSPFTGNKTDRDDREIPPEVGDEFAQRHGMEFLETSAKASDNVEALFSQIATELLQVSEEGHR